MSGEGVEVKAIERVVPHVSIILSGMLIVFLILDRFNPAMGYLDNGGEKVVLLVLAVSSILSSIVLIGYQRRT
jgi:hypothetical protein